MRESCTSGLTRGEALTLPYSTANRSRRPSKATNMATAIPRIIQTSLANLISLSSNVKPFLFRLFLN